jgi:hypothetical protein
VVLTLTLTLTLTLARRPSRPSRGANPNPDPNPNPSQAAVKAIAWCPWQRNLLASGGGTADRATSPLEP